MFIPFESPSVFYNRGIFFVINILLITVTVRYNKKRAKKGLRIYFIFRQ